MYNFVSRTVTLRHRFPLEQTNLRRLAFRSTRRFEGRVPIIGGGLINPVVVAILTAGSPLRFPGC